MLSLEDQIEQIADAAFAQTSPVEWHDPTERDVSSGSGRRFRPALVAVAAAVLVVGLVGGLIALVDSNRGDPISPGITDAASIPPTSSGPIPTTAEVSAPPTSLDASPVPPPTTASTDEGAALDACSPLGVCTYRSMNDGRLVRLDSRFKNDELPAATIYGANSSTTVFFDESFAPSSAFLLDVGPGDIAYVWWIAPGAESATVSAFELGGAESGRLVRQFEAPVDRSGDTELVPTRLGFVELGCCGVEPTRPPTEARVVVPWVDRNGAEIVADDRSVFVVTVNERLGIEADRPDGTSQSWDVSFGDVAPRGMPYLFELDDGRVVAILDGADATSDPLYLAPDGTVEQVASPGPVSHVLPDGRFVIRGPNNNDVLIDPNPIDAAETPSTTIDSTAQPPGLGRPLVAIDGNGDAVMFETDDTSPIVLYDGQDPDTASTLGDGPNAVDRMSVAADRSIAYIGLCCAPVVGTILETAPPAPAVPGPTPTYGYAPTLNPAATRLAATASSSLVVTDLATGQALTVEATGDEMWDTAHDLIWLDDTTLALLGSQARMWSLTIISVEGETIDAGPTRAFAPFEDFASLRFAGTAVPDEIAMHDIGTNRVLSGTIDDYGNHNDSRGSSLQVIELPGPALSAWYSDPGQLIWTDTARTLRVGGNVIPGDYLWARR